MSPPDAPSVALSEKKPDLLARAGWLIVLLLVGYFVSKYVPRYFVYSEASYGKYFWPKAMWLLPHVAGGLLAILIGPLQFWSRIRRDYLGFHRIAGRVYVVAVVFGSFAAFRLAATADGGIAYALGLTGLGVAWLTTTVMAFVAIRKKNLTQHKQWMVRSYVVTFAFVSFRLLDEALAAGKFMPDDERNKMLAWACWAVPLLFTEVAIQAGSVFKSRS